jgi:hypothetical protein
MIIQGQSNLVTRSNVGTETKFSIKASAEAFDVLASGLYSNEILAIIRELSANAWDSHTAAGNTETPFEIKLPNTMDPEFYVKDFGTGLSPEQITTLYTTVFDSDKQDSNNFIGGLGLGSKSPFSYTSNFIVESRYNGIKYIYSCFKDEDGVPSITLMAQMNTDEHNGMTVQLSVKKNDMYRFTDNAKKALMYYDPQPIVIGGTESNFKPYSLNHTVSGSNWKIRDSEYDSRMVGPYVVQGFIPYPIDGALLREQTLTNTAYALTRVAIDFNLNIGDVDVAASRGALKYRKSTIEMLVSCFEQAAVEIHDSIQTRFDACANEWEVGVLMEALQEGYGYEFGNVYKAFQHNGAEFTWNGKKVARIIELDTVGITNSTITTYVRGNKKTLVSASKIWTPNHSYQQAYTITVSKNTYVLTDTAAKGNNAVYHEFLKNTKDPSKTTLIVVRPVSAKALDQSEIDKVVKSIGSPTVSAIDKLPTLVAAKKKYVYKKKEKMERLVWEGFTSRSGRYRDEVHRVFSRNCWSKQLVDLSAGGLYVPIDKFTIISPANSSSQFDTLIHIASKMGMLDKASVIYGFTAPQVQEVVDDPSWINVFDFLKSQYAVLNKNNVLQSKIISKHLFDSIGFEFKNKLINNWDRLEARVVDGEFKTTIEQFSELNKAAKLVMFDSYDMANFARWMGIPDDSQSVANKLQQTWYDLIEGQYNMLRYFPFSRMDNPDLDRMIEYVNMMEKIKLTEALV